MACDHRGRRVYLLITLVTVALLTAVAMASLLVTLFVRIGWR